jgi:hypothetical protein
MPRPPQGRFINHSTTWSCWAFPGSALAVDGASNFLDLFTAHALDHEVIVKAVSLEMEYWLLVTICRLPNRQA